MQRFVQWTLILAVMLQIAMAGAQTPTPEDSWTSDYVAALVSAARNDPSGCLELRRLASVLSAPIAPLARARELQYCRQKDPSGAIRELQTMLQEPATVWLRPMLAEVVIGLAVANSDLRALAENAILNLSNLSSQKEKEQLLQAAVRAAKTLGLSAREQELLTTLYAISPRKQPSPPQTEWMKVANDFKVNEEWSDAKIYYNRLLQVRSLSATDQLRAWDGLRQIDKAKFRSGLGPLDQFLKSSKEVARFSQGQLGKAGATFVERQVLVEAWVQYARDEWSYGDEGRASAELTQILTASFVEDLFKAYAFLYRSRIYAGGNLWSKAASAATEGTQILTQQLNVSDQWTAWVWNLWDDCFWAEAFANRKAGALQASLAALQWGATYSKSASSRVKFKFWMAENEKVLGMASASSADWFEVVNMDPNGYYGFVAHGELGQAITTLPDFDLSDVAKPASVGADDFAVLHWLVRAGEMPLAQKYSRQVLSDKSYAVDDLRLRAFVGDFMSNWTIFFARIPPEQRDAFLASNARLFFPKPYFNSVATAVAKTTGVDADYVYAIMRQESGFNPWARSPVNAYGLLQLMPSTARRIAPGAGVSFTDDHELFLPAVNIPIGVAFMDELFGKVSGSFILRTIGYNTELAKGLEWKQRLYQGDIFEFIEQIPYEETRSYVRLVMRNYLMNKRLNSPLPFLFPLDLLKL